MMDQLEEAILYATVMHTGAKRKMTGTPYILHPLEVAQIISVLTDDTEVMAAGVLHDIVEDTDGTLEEIRKRFGNRVAELVASETEVRHPNEDQSASWKKRKQESLLALHSATDPGVKILWLGDKLSNLRSLARMYSEQGEDLWKSFHQQDPAMHRWYYQSIAEELELDLNRTGAFKEMVRLINAIWPGTFPNEKARYKKYRELDISGLEVLSSGAKSTVYRYTDDLIVKVYNRGNTFKEIERENTLARKAFIAGIPTAISYGIVAVGDRYGSVFELIDSNTISGMIAANPAHVTYYAGQMANLALTIHHTDARALGLPGYMNTVHEWISFGLEYCDRPLADRISTMLDALPQHGTMIHADFHTGNVMIQRDELLLIDMDGISVCHPIVELGGLYRAYVGLGELDPEIVEHYMGFSYDTAKTFFHAFLAQYLGTQDEEKISEVTRKAALLAYVRMLHRCYAEGPEIRPEQLRYRDYLLGRIRELARTVDSFDFECSAADTDPLP